MELCDTPAKLISFYMLLGPNLGPRASARPICTTYSVIHSSSKAGSTPDPNSSGHPLLLTSSKVPMKHVN